MINRIFQAQNRLSEDFSRFGYLYNGFVISNSLFSPNSLFKIPSLTEWNTLKSHTASQGYSGEEAKPLKSIGGWQVSGIDLYGFRSVPSGWRSGSDGTFNSYVVGSTLNYLSDFFTFTTHDQTPSGFYTAQFSGIKDFNEHDFLFGTPSFKDGFPVRFIYSGSGTPSSSITDLDGNKYDIIQIGSQYWTASNYKGTKLRDGTSLTKVTNNTTWANATSSDLYYCAYENNERTV